MEFVQDLHMMSTHAWSKHCATKYGQLKDKKPNNNPAKKFVYYVSQLYYDGHYYIILYVVQVTFKGKYFMNAQLCHYSLGNFLQMRGS